MENSSILKNELIFDYAAGNTSLAKSILASTYLFLNSTENNLFSEFESYCGAELKNVNQIKPRNINFENCISNNMNNSTKDNQSQRNPINYLMKNLKWKKKFSGFYEYSYKLSKNETVKLIKMNPGAKVPLHSHNGKEYILVLEGSFCDEFGVYSKGNLQINDSKIKHTPVACNNEGCICLTFTEEDLVFYGPFAPILNLITFLKSFLKIS